MNRFIRKQQKEGKNMIYNRVRRKPLLRDYLSGGFLLWMHFVKHRELLLVEHIGVRHSKIEIKFIKNVVTVQNPVRRI